MPLVDLLKNLANFPYYYGGFGNFTQKSIPFGKDQPGGLSSGEPYVRFPLPDNASGTTLDYYAANKASLDYPMRGGSLQYLNNVAVITKTAEYDYQRIKRFLKSSPKGYTFLAKQIGLQLSNPNIEVGQQANLGSNATPSRFFGTIGNNRIYNGGINTLTQIRLQGTGIHTDRAGAVPYNPVSQTYERVVSSYNQKNDGQGNRLVMLLNNKMLGANRLRTDPTNAGNPSNNAYFSNLEGLLRLGIPKSNETVLFQYLGGPNSAYGIGLTTIRRYVNSFDPGSNTPKSYLHASANDANSKTISVADIFRYSRDTWEAARPGYAFYTEANRSLESSSPLISYLKVSSSVLFQNGAVPNLYLYKQGATTNTTNTPEYASQQDIFALKRDQLLGQRPGYFYYTEADTINNSISSSKLANNVRISGSTLFQKGTSPSPYLYKSSEPGSSTTSMSDILALTKAQLQETRPGYFYYTEANKSEEGQDRMVKRLEEKKDSLDAFEVNTLVFPESVANNNTKTFNYNTFYTKAVSLRNKKWTDDAITDFRSVINTEPGGVGAFKNAVDYKTQNLQSRIGIAGPGKSDSVTRADIGEDYDTSVADRRSDLIKFRFQIITYNGGAEIPLIFRAYLTNFQDNHNGEFSPFRYIGRGENFYIYNGFTRNISFNFKVAAESKQELRPIYRKLNFLVSQMYPDYNSNGFMRTPLLKLTIGDYLYEQPGFLTTIGLSAADTYPWEINFDGDAFEAPQVLDVTCQFTPLHDFLPQRSKGPDSITPLILTPKKLSNAS